MSGADNASSDFVKKMSRLSDWCGANRPETLVGSVKDADLEHVPKVDGGLKTWYSIGC